MVFWLSQKNLFLKFKNIDMYIEYCLRMMVNFEFSNAFYPYQKIESIFKNFNSHSKNHKVSRERDDYISSQPIAK